MLDALLSPITCRKHLKLKCLHGVLSILLNSDSTPMVTERGRHGPYLFRVALEESTYEGCIGAGPVTEFKYVPLGLRTHLADVTDKQALRQRRAHRGAGEAGNQFAHLIHTSHTPSSQTVISIDIFPL